MKHHFAATLLISAFCLAVHAEDADNQAAYIKPGDNMVLEHVPSIPSSVAEATARYGEYRFAQFQSWSPLRREMIVGTRFANTVQLHLVKHPGGARQQLTFFPDRVRGGSVEPTGGDSLVFSKDVGGSEWYQLYRFDMPTGNSTLLTDGRSRNGGALFEHSGSRIAYTSTRRNNQDTDLYLMDIHRPKTDHMLVQLQGGGWQPEDFSRDGSEVLLQEYLSINQSNLYIVNVAGGEKKQITSRQQPGHEVYYGGAMFTRGGEGIYVTTDLDSDFQRLAYFDLATMTPHYLTASIPWDIEGFDLSEDGRTLAFFANENGSSKLYLLDTDHGTFRPVANLPPGIIDSVVFHKNNRDLGFSLHSAKSPGDAYSVDVMTGRVERWTYSETGGLNPATFSDPRLVSWKSFDGRQISGWLYRPDPRKFAGKRPVILDIHGGPEGESRPDFMGRNNYVLNELGVAILLPNVRGSTGYGKEFTKLDNGFHRDDSYKDIGAALDWIATQPELDASRIMVFGGSYGGHMTWATAAYYNDKIRCAMPLVGMSNLVTFLEHTEAYRRDLRRVEYGDERDPAMRAYLERIAPMNHLESMHKPIFAVVGRNDPRVPWSESRQIIDKLNAQGTPTWFMVANDEGHGYAKKSNNDLMFDAEVMFIRTYLLGGMTPAL
jgi:dipeptidyl aminopeptidase/acylaminoacyl peptidase